MNTISFLCATLALFCYGQYEWDFKYDNRIEFIDGIRNCAIAYNSTLNEYQRIPVELTIIQALHESGANGIESRFAVEGNNFFGMKALDDEDFMLSQTNPPAKVAVFERKCDSVISYVNLLNNDINYEEFRNEMLKQYVGDEVNIERLIDTLSIYAEDTMYVVKLKRMARTLRKEGVITR